MPGNKKIKAAPLSIGQKIERIRLYSGVKQKWLAAQLGLSQQTVSVLEKQQTIEEDRLVQIADALNSSADIIRHFNGEETIQCINRQVDGQAGRPVGCKGGLRSDEILNQIAFLYEQLSQNEKEKTALFIKNRCRLSEKMDKRSSNAVWPIGKRIEKIRILRGITQSQLGSLLGVSKQAISKMEQRITIAEPKLEWIAQALGVSLKALRTFNETAVLSAGLAFFEREKHSIAKHDDNPNQVQKIPN